MFIFIKDNFSEQNLWGCPISQKYMIVIPTAVGISSGESGNQFFYALWIPAFLPARQVFTGMTNPYL
jgi:hypothetical protein